MKQVISVFGMGYVGCVSAACLARAGHEVIGVDINTEKVRLINELGKSPIIEPGLEELMGETTRAGRLRATTDCREAVERSDIAFICVGTPGDQHGQLNLDALRRVCRDIGECLRDRERPFTVVVRSTMLPGTLDNTVRTALREAAGAGFESRVRLAINPEFIREGSALKDFESPPFTLVGCEEEETAELLRSIYNGVEAPFLHTSITTAEMVKYACNAFHALKVCFANEIGDSCEALGADAQEVMRIFRMDDKLNVSPAYLRPGFAFGGSCLPKDVKALLYAAHHADVSVPVLEAILPSNQAQIQRGIDAVLATGKKKIGVAGLAFKPDTDDLRESPLVTLVEALIGKGLDVQILDRNVSLARLTGANRQYINEEIPHISSLMCEAPEALVEHAEVLVVGTDNADSEKLCSLARPDQVIVDLTRKARNRSAPAQQAA
ncbi:MAG: UDP-glucose/GDP-mannose dehydrogenase family protein [Xanthomonadales bacterium]|jgi:GDP-mannose 6-dehydrogenase|nr:UDP-glucose/GDP-mannose dehydrogenase family protein [Xanthomonadales bacterium]